jgi:hypothetical protein
VVTTASAGPIGASQLLGRLVPWRPALWRPTRDAIEQYAVEAASGNDYQGDNREREK